MRPALLSIPTLTFTILAGLQAQAQTADACSGFAWSVAREQAAFSGQTLPTIKSSQQYPGVLEGVRVELEPQSGLTYPKLPARAPKANKAYGAVLSAPPIAQAGVYQITLSNEAWVDVVQNDTVLRSASFSGKTGCPGIRKSVRFNLTTGPLVIEISDAATPSLNLDLLPAE